MKKEIISLNKEIGKNFKRAYRFLGSAKCIHDDWRSLNYESLDSNKIYNPSDEFPVSAKESTSNFIIVKSNKLKLLL